MRTFQRVFAFYHLHSLRHLGRHGFEDVMSDTVFGCIALLQTFHIFLSVTKQEQRDSVSVYLVRSLSRSSAEGAAKTSILITEV